MAYSSTTPTNRSTTSTASTASSFSYAVAVTPGSGTESVSSTNGSTTHAVPVTGSGGFNGKSAYQLAVDAGFEGTLQEWLFSLQGEDGATGEFSPLTVVASQSLSGETVVTLNSQNRARILNVTQASDAGMPALITTQAGITGDELRVVSSGYLDFPPNNLTPGAAIYLGLNGQLSTSIPAGAKFALVIGRAVTPGKIWIDVSPAVMLVG